LETSGRRSKEARPLSDMPLLLLEVLHLGRFCHRRRKYLARSLIFLQPIVGGAIVSSYLRWRWTEYLTGIMMMFFLLLDVIVLDETYGPVLLVAKARRLRHESGNWALHARHEEWDVSLQSWQISS